MVYDFETIVDRKKNAASKYQEVPENVVAMSVADMEFLVADEIVSAMHQCADEMNPYGYQSMSEEYQEAVVSWMKRRHHMKIEKDWICFSNGVVHALYQCVERLTQVNDGVIIFTPVYGPFYHAIKNQNRQCVECPFINHHEAYTIDFDDFEQKCAQENNKMVLLCSPHNPIGKVFTREELQKICDIVVKYDLILVADEIHHDLILEGEHVSVGSLNDSILQRSIICTSPSKSFNLAGLSVSNILIPNEALRAKYKQKDHVNLNPFSMKACIAAYNEGEKWLEELLVVIRKNAQIAYDFFAQYDPIEVTHIQGTYLLWINLSSFGLEQKELMAYLKKFHLYVSDGESFGAKGYIRMNLALPTRYLQIALSRFQEAFACNQ